MINFFDAKFSKHPIEINLRGENLNGKYNANTSLKGNKINGKEENADNLLFHLVSFGVICLSVFITKSVFIVV